jgi:hypothetical protein
METGTSCKVTFGVGFLTTGKCSTTEVEPTTCGTEPTPHPVDTATLADSTPAKAAAKGLDVTAYHIGHSSLFNETMKIN